MLTLQVIARASRPLYVLLAALTYILGAGIARYLGIVEMPSVFWLGLVGMLLAQMSMALMAEVFRVPRESHLPDEASQGIAVRDAALYMSLAALTAGATIAFVLYKDDRLGLPTLACLFFSLLSIVLYGVPPARLIDRGFGELLLAIHIAYLAPSIGFLLQARTYHRLLNVSVLPMTFLLLAMLLALDFPAYADDLKHGRRTLLTRMGWEMAVPLHQALLVIGYLLLAAAMLLGFSFGLLWPAFLTIPFALLQIVFLRNIALGARPIWGLLTANAIAVFCLTAYFLTLSFWLR